MPTYSYECENCGHEFEQFQYITAKSLRKCPRCGKLKLRRLIGTGAGVIFKGNGFYETDYRSESYKKAADKEKTGPEKETPKRENQSESKVAESANKTEKDTSNKKKTA
jgi:putative FmdB family regulatory protein